MVNFHHDRFAMGFFMFLYWDKTVLFVNALGKKVGKKFADSTII